MTRLRSLPKAGGRNGGRGTGRSRPDDQAELVAAARLATRERYRSQPARPIAQLAVRILLWGAVALGALGGLVGLLRSPPEAPAPVAAPSPDQVLVPAPVAGMAEVVVEDWLSATEDDLDRLATLFVEPPTLDGLTPNGLTVDRASAVAGRPRQEGYWSVVVEAEVTETVPVVDDDTTDPAAAEDGPAGAAPTTEEQRTVTWYLEVSIVGDVRSGFAALTTPAVLPGPPEVSTGWRASLDDPEEPSSDDVTARTVAGFLDALLAGAGDPERYMAPGVNAAAAEPAPFADVEVATLAIDQLSDDEYRVLAEVWATTPGGTRQAFSYELVVVERLDRLEITQFSGAPSRVAGSADPREPDEATSGGATGGGGRQS